MSVIAVARRYAEALADVAIEHGQVEQIDREVRAFTELMETSKDLYDVFASPMLPMSDKRRVLDAVLDRSRPSRMTANLLRTLLSHYRLHHLSEVYKQFARELNERKGLIVAEVTTAGEVGSSERTKLGHTLERLTGKQVEFTFKTDTSLIGGVVTRIESVVYDGSVRTQLQGIKQRMKQGDSAI